MKVRGKFRSDRSVVPLLLSNVLAIVWPLVEECQLLDGMTCFIA